MIYTAEAHPGVRVFVDGIERFDCFLADDEKGIVRGFKQQGNDDNTNPNGQIDPSKAVVEYHGRVDVVAENGKAPWE